MRKGVQDAAVKLLTNVDAGQLAVFSEVRTRSCCGRTAVTNLSGPDIHWMRCHALPCTADGSF